MTYYGGCSWRHGRGACACLLEHDNVATCKVMFGTTLHKQPVFTRSKARRGNLRNLCVESSRVLMHLQRWQLATEQVSLTVRLGADSALLRNR